MTRPIWKGNISFGLVNIPVHLFTAEKPSEAAVISQIPINRITIMSSGRSNTINCGGFGTIEFIHTVQKPEQIMQQLSYDDKCKLWRASIPLALRDMKTTRRDLDLIDEGSIK